MALDEASSRLLAGLPERPDLSTLDVAALRTWWAQARPGPDPGPSMASEQARRIAVSGGHLPLRLLLPVERPDAVAVYFHGGGWVAGDVDSYLPFARHLAARTGWAVGLVGYRRAPEYRFPTAADDASAALAWMAARVAAFAGRDVPLVVAGDSAGGNLAAVAALRARRTPPATRPALQLLLYPVTDCDFETTSYTDPDNQVLLSRPMMEWLWDHYAPDPPSRLHPDASPLREPDLRQAPPAIIATAEHDVLRDDGEIYATRLLKAGVPVRHRRFEGQMHGFASMPGLVTAAEEALSWVAESARALLAG